MQHNPTFYTLIQEPLEAVTNRMLLHISYWLLPLEVPLFDMETANASGLYAISMLMGEKILLIYSGWTNPLRESNAYHIETRLVSGSNISEGLVQEVTLVEVPADETTLWHKALLQSLTAVEVCGFRSSPQFIRFSFTTTTVIVAIGYSGNPLLLGDGDDILVCTEEELRNMDKMYPDEWAKLWEYGTLEDVTNLAE